MFLILKKKLLNNYLKITSSPAPEEVSAVFILPLFSHGYIKVDLQSPFWLTRKDVATNSRLALGFMIFLTQCWDYSHHYF